ncbi:MAG: hypothetical protein JRI23_34015 [Deltaproteobacteria bacterium]|jgi:hypothetical protein|nr:hypothetical protein [Deltaproteobacteria bacterium]MBW2537309.1 hypothetical protein [Deltaproteobacteria bacterium]
MKRFTLPLTAASAVVAALAPATASAAGPEACGGIDFWAVSECHFEFDGGCESQCEPLSFSAACDGQCNLDIEGSCTASCEASCSSECEYNPAQFSCEASCTADCSAHATAHCGTDSSCASYFEANCQAQCEGECSLVPPSASCEARCEASCAGSCDLRANAECEVECTAELEGGCEVDCQQPEGALFCDGQYVPVQDLPTCVEYLVDNFSVELEAEAHAEMTLSCATARPGRDDLDAALWLAGLALGAVAIRRRRR